MLALSADIAGIYHTCTKWGVAKISEVREGIVHN